MSEIPADIMSAARYLVRQFPCLWPYGAEYAEDAIAEALYLKRLRCASAYMHWARKMMEKIKKE